MRIFEWFFYLTVLLLPTQLGVHFWPDWTLVLGRRVDYLSPTIFLTDITILITICTWFAQTNAIKNLVKTFWQYKLVSFITITLIALNCFFSSNPILSILKWAKVLEYILFFYVIYVSKPSLRKTVYCFGIALLYSSVIAISQFFMQHTLGGIFWFLGERTFSIDTPGIAKVNWCWPSKTQCIELLRPYATLPHPNILGGFLATTIPLILLQLKKTRILSAQIFLITSIVFGLCALGITFSRGAWIIGTALFIGVFAWSKTKKKWVIWIMSSMTIVFGFLFAWPYIQTLNKTNESVFIRLDLAQAALQLFLSHPYTGIGLGTFLPNLPAILQIRDLYFLQPVHNIYLLLLSETGSIGVLLIGIVAYIYKKMKRPQGAWALYIPSIALCLLGLIDHYPFTVQQGQLLMTCFFALPFLKKNS
ncbi:MAG: O-antigen ligase family protein [Microgenomates group bacterium]